MTIPDLAVAVFIGNAMTLSAAFAFREFIKKDERASGLAYAGFLLPIGFALLALI